MEEDQMVVEEGLLAGRPAAVTSRAKAPLAGNVASRSDLATYMSSK